MFSWTNINIDSIAESTNKISVYKTVNLKLKGTSQAPHALQSLRRTASCYVLSGKQTSGNLPLRKVSNQGKSLPGNLSPKKKCHSGLVPPWNMSKYIGINSFLLNLNYHKLEIYSGIRNLSQLASLALLLDTLLGSSIIN